MFANLDGRRRTFGKSMDVVRVGADTRFVDHAVTALKLWAESALGAGRLILQMRRFLTADFLGQTSSVLVQLRTLLLSVHLLGRPGCKTASDMRGYHLKFMPNDLYVFMACATCANRQEPVVASLAVGCGIFAPRSCFGAPVLYVWRALCPAMPTTAARRWMPRLPDGQHFEQRCRSTSKSHPIYILCKCCHASGVILCAWLPEDAAQAK